MAIIDENELQRVATQYFYGARRHIRKKDMNLYRRCKALSKSDMDFLEQLLLIHIKNITKGSKIEQNFCGVLDNYIMNNLFTQHFFSSWEVFRMICYRLSLLPQNVLIRDIESYCNTLVQNNLKKYKAYKGAENMVALLEPLPNLSSDIESYIQTCLQLFLREKIDAIIINPLNLVLNPTFKEREQLTAELTQNLQTLLQNSNAKKLVLENDCEYLEVLLKAIENALQTISYPVDISITLPSYHLMSLEALKYIAALSKRLCAQKKAKLCVRLKDIDFSYEVMEFQALHTHAPNSHFTNKSNAMSNLITLIDECAKHKEVLLCHVVTNNLLLIALLGQMDMKVRLEVEPLLHYPLYKVLRHGDMPLFALQYYTNHRSDIIALRLKMAHTSLRHGLLEYISMLYNKQEWEKKCKAFAQNLKQSKKENKHTISDNARFLQAEHYNFETFDYTLRKPLQVFGFALQDDCNTQDSKDMNEASTKEQPQLLELENLQIASPNTNKLEDILYLNAQDMHRLNMQSMNNMPATFSLYAEKEKEALANAQQKYDEIVQNRMNIITSIIARLQECMPQIFATLCALSPNTPPHLYEEQVYMLLDSFKYYAYTYKQLLGHTESVLLMPLGAIFVHTKKLAIHEIGAVLASNIVIGNISFLEDSLLSRILYVVFQPLFDFCPFMCIMETSKARSGGFIDYEIITKQDFMRLQSGEKTTNYLVWDKGVSVVFISSFYDIHEAAKQVQYMRCGLHSQILIYTDCYAYDIAKQIFIPLQVTQLSLFELINNLPEDTSNVSLFTYNKAEMNYAINKLKVSISINGAYKSKLISGSPRTFSPGYLQPFGSKLLLGKLVQTSPNSVILNNSLYSDIIGCFGEILSADEIEFLYNLNHNYSQFLSNLARIASLDNIYEAKKPYDMCVRIYENDDFFHVCVLMLIGFLLQIPTRLSFVPEYFKQTPETPDKLQAALQEKYIEHFTLVFEDEKTFQESLSAQTLVRILQDELQFATTPTYTYLSNKGIIAEYALPILNSHLELERYLATQYIQIEPNILLQTHVHG